MSSLHHRILAAAYRPLKLASGVGRSLGVSPENRLRVLLHHDIPPEEQEGFAVQLRWLARSWNFVSPGRFSAMMSGEEPILGQNLLLTFDDGFASNRAVAEQVLNPIGIRALFFVVSDFVAIGDRDEARRFVARRIQPGSRAEDLPAHWENMSWTDLDALLEQGHAIGAHTRTHARLSDLSSETELESEIVESADRVQSRLGVPVDHFAYTFGDLGSFSEAALQVAARRFRFVHSGLRGGNSISVPPAAIRRDSSAAQDPRSNYRLFPNSLIGALLEGAADFHYARSRRRLDGWARSANANRE